jgi:hypothetical protein
VSLTICIAWGLRAVKFAQICADRNCAINQSNPIQHNHAVTFLGPYLNRIYTCVCRDGSADLYRLWDGVAGIHYKPQMSAASNLTIRPSAKFNPSRTLLLVLQ